MKYYLDTEFNGFGGDLISLALVREDNEYLYLVRPDWESMPVEEWVGENVIPIIRDCPAKITYAEIAEWSYFISDFIYGNGVPEIIADWPSDIMDFCKLLMVGPGYAVPMGNETRMTIRRHIDVYPTTLEGAVQHNAWWDAMALKELLSAK